MCNPTIYRERDNIAHTTHTETRLIQVRKCLLTCTNSKAIGLQVRQGIEITKDLAAHAVVKDYNLAQSTFT